MQRFEVGGVIGRGAGDSVGSHLTTSTVTLVQATIICQLVCCTWTLTLGLHGIPTTPQSGTALSPILQRRKLRHREQRWSCWKGKKRRP